ncbi:MAG: GNAT family N-acetyltransferase [Bacilli bacterium]
MSMRTILGCIKQADLDYELINDGDRIAIGISGGKDSLILLSALNLYKQFSKKKYEIVGINIEMGFPDMSFTKIRKYCKDNNIEFHQVKSKPLIYEVLKLNADEAGNISCSICSRMKKAAMNKAAKTYHCNKVAFAHHNDDAVETLFMNMIHGGRIATFSPKMHLTRANMTFIRPLVYCEEKDIRKTALELNLPILESTCPANKHTERQNMKNLLHDFYHNYPESRQNFSNMLSNTAKLSLWKKVNENDREWILNSLKLYNDTNIHDEATLTLTRLDPHGNLIGGLTYHQIDQEICLDVIYVKEEWRKQGLGSSLLTELSKQDYQVITCKIYSYNHLAFFLKNEYEIIGKVENISYLAKKK